MRGAYSFLDGSLLASDGRVYTFGSGYKGRLGHGVEENKLVPTMIESLKDTNIVQVAAGESHTVLLDERGQVYTFGDGDYGKVIGKRGRNVSAIRTILFAINAKEGGKRARLELMDDGE